MAQIGATNGASGMLALEGERREVGDGSEHAGAKSNELAGSLCLHAEKMGAGLQKDSSEEAITTPRSCASSSAGSCCRRPLSLNRRVMDMHSNDLYFFSELSRAEGIEVGKSWLLESTGVSLSRASSRSSSPVRSPSRGSCRLKLTIPSSPRTKRSSPIPTPMDRRRRLSDVIEAFENDYFARAMSSRNLLELAAPHDTFVHEQIWDFVCYLLMSCLRLLRYLLSTSIMDLELETCSNLLPGGLITFKSLWTRSSSSSTQDSSDSKGSSSPESLLSKSSTPRTRSAVKQESTVSDPTALK
ncbi:hypothetical protein GUITHDRAFT_116300 [Guillardia theta CCMP2712]|uniref:Uncharacterized protein n=1 Tax=Guillardia theta (strain CCMP2712) TaxID=905079 RepID=L1IMJ5_GUITC|nr:hypothetical protein GUITHDRAFT_116300 [Guillardia theta CCMP2712]EKX37493.1 hypothetical protein GUITHDRAFT_116300 [Guillardia theta CCMP2712]|eukprot:XP_005824473.1 hypothetical protein GUITHDRAFT_116300 [Guillardia theta CCMP2712]